MERSIGIKIFLSIPPLPGSTVSTEIFMDEIKPVITEKHEFEGPHVSKIEFFSHYQVPDATNRIDNFSSEWFATSSNRSIETLMKQIQLVFNQI